MQRKRETFYWRAFVTFYVVLSFLLIVGSGVVLFIAPPGRVANWADWRFGALQKAHWQAVHTVFTFLFVVAAGFHVYFNWRVLVAYVRSKVGDGVRRGRELALASGVAGAILTLTLAGVPPFSTLISIGETAKSAWSDPTTEPPVPHAELWTLEKFSESTKVPVEAAMDNLKRAGMPTQDKNATLHAIATTYRTTPKQVYAKALGEAKPAAVPLAEGGGYGQKTVQQVAAQLNLPLSTALERLRNSGMTEAAGDSNIGSLATAYGRRPFEVGQILQAPTPPGAH